MNGKYIFSFCDAREPLCLARLEGLGVCYFFCAHARHMRAMRTRERGIFIGDEREKMLG